MCLRSRMRQPLARTHETERSISGETKRVDHHWCLIGDRGRDEASVLARDLVDNGTKGRNSIVSFELVGTSHTGRVLDGVGDERVENVLVELVLGEEGLRRGERSISKGTRHAHNNPNRSKK